MLDDFVPSQTHLREVRPKIVSVLPPDAEGGPYDSRAATYDRVVGSVLYNRLLWGTSPERYRAFARVHLTSSAALGRRGGCAAVLRRDAAGGRIGTRCGGELGAEGGVAFFTARVGNDAS